LISVDEVVEVRANARLVLSSGERTAFAACQVRAAPDGLYLDGRRHVVARDVVHGTVEGRGDDAHLILTCREQARFDVGPLERDVARRMLAALHLDASHRVATYRRGTSVPKAIGFALAAPTLGAVVLLARLGPDLRTWIAVLAAGLVLLLALLRPLLRTRIQVGADAVTVRRFGTRTVRLPYAQIASLRAVLETVVFTPRGGPDLSVPGPLDQDGNGARIGESLDAYGLRMAVECVEHVEQAMAQATPETVDLELSRAHRGVQGWVADLRALGARQTFRDRAVPEARLWQLVLSASEPVTRAAAAVALGPSLDEEGRERLRAAAQAVVTPKLRVALEAAAEGREAEIERALVELEEETEGPRRGA